MSASKLLAGALLAGMGVAAGGATLSAVAAGVGVNWLSEGLVDLWPRLASSPPDPLARAYAAAIRSGVAGLKERYRRTVDGRTDLAAFDLVAACANDIAAAEFPANAAEPNAAQTALTASLAALLHGHDPRQAAFLGKELLPACATAFQQWLLGDEPAWRAFHGLILQGLAANSAVLMTRIEGFAQLLAGWSDPAAGLEQLRRLEAQIAALARQPAPGPIFDNRGLRVGGSVYQAAGDQYIGSAHAQAGGTATATNTFGVPFAAPAWPQPAAPAAATLLFLAANPWDTASLELDQEARRLDQALRQGRYAASFHLTQQWAVRGEEMLDALLRHRPAIVHFAGHGDAEGRLKLEDAIGRAADVLPAALAGLLAATGGVRCVVLNACFSDALAAALTQVVPCVVGMTNEVEDSAAIAFSAGFYRALADGADVAQAAAAGHAQALAEGGDDAAPPSPHVRAAANVDPAALRF